MTIRRSKNDMICERCGKEYNGEYNCGYYCEQCVLENENIEQLEKLEGHSHYCAMRQVFWGKECICGNETN